MRIYIIGNDGITLCRETPAAVNDGEIAVTSNEELHAAPLKRQPQMLLKLPVQLRLLLRLKGGCDRYRVIVAAGTNHDPRWPAGILPDLDQFHSHPLPWSMADLPAKLCAAIWQACSCSALSHRGRG